MLRNAQAQHAYKADQRRVNAGRGSDLKQHRTTIFAEDGEHFLTTKQQREDQLISDEWLMAKRLATASRLSVQWRGDWDERQNPPRSRFHLVETINFRRILLGSEKSRGARRGRTFTVSGCGKYLLVRSGHDIFVYKIDERAPSMAAVVRLAAQHEVLAVSMDTSSGRMAVAALLDNNVGAVWDISEGGIAGLSRSHNGEPMQLGMLTEVRGPHIQDRAESVAGNLPLRRPEYRSSSSLNAYLSTTSTRPKLRTRSTSSSSNSRGSIHSYLFSDVHDIVEEPEDQNDQDGDGVIGIAIQTRPSSTYHNIGSVEDQPRSVAICPQRKCVAFGCKHGIELHWVDALTGGDLNRWFPLQAPSDYLYFLPQRVGIDSNKKLRLISSAAGPMSPAANRSGSLPAALKVRQRTHDRGRRQSMTRLFFGSLPFPASVLPNSWTSGETNIESDRQGVLRTVDCDHYQAVPLSDGIHMLYTDPVSGTLCLGSDALPGGPTKLIRKVVFMPPTVGDDGWAGLMSSYNAGREMQWGVRIIAAHRDGRIILYNVPSDVFNYLRSLRSSTDVWDETAGVMAQSDLLMDDLLSTHPNTIADDGMANFAACLARPESPFKTVQIEGSEVAHVGSDIVDDVAVDTSCGGVRVWIFCRSGIARQMNIFVPPEHEVHERFVSNNGLLYEASHDIPAHVETFEALRRSQKGKERATSDELDTSPDR